jgi:hypothetical protein
MGTAAIAFVAAGIGWLCGLYMGLSSREVMDCLERRMFDGVECDDGR